MSGRRRIHFSAKRFAPKNRKALLISSDKPVRFPFPPYAKFLRFFNPFYRIFSRAAKKRFAFRAFMSAAAFYGAAGRQLRDTAHVRVRDA